MKLAIAVQLAKKYKLSAPPRFYDLSINELRKVVNRGG